MLQQFVLDNGLDVGFAFDGDADRCLAVDKSGMVIDGDKILYIYGCYMKERGKLVNNTVVTTVMSNFGLYKAFDEKGHRLCQDRRGRQVRLREHARKRTPAGRRTVGHIIFGKYATTGDGVLTAIKLMQVMIEKKASLRELCAPMKVYPQLFAEHLRHRPQRRDARSGICSGYRPRRTGARRQWPHPRPPERDGACDPDPCGGRHRRGLRGAYGTAGGADQKQGYIKMRFDGMFDLTHTIAAPCLKTQNTPGRFCPGSGDFIRAAGPALPAELYEQTAPEVWIAKDAEVAPSACIAGPCIVGPGAQIRHCAFVRGSAVIGAGAVVGNSTG